MDLGLAYPYLKGLGRGCLDEDFKFLSKWIWTWFFHDEIGRIILELVRCIKETSKASREDFLRVCKEIFLLKKREKN